MIIVRKDFRLTPIRHDDIEQVRLWRNSPAITKYMEFQKHITTAMQEQWWRELQDSNDFYFIISLSQRPVGLIHLRLESLSKGESGLFIGEEDYWDSPVAYMSSLPLLDLGFNFLGLRQITAKVHKENSRALSYNASLGFIYEKGLSENFQEYSISSEVFQKAVNGNRAFNSMKGSYTLYTSQFERFEKDNLGIFISRLEPLTD